MRMTRENGSSIDTGKWGRVSVTHKHGRALKDTGDPVLPETKYQVIKENEMNT